MYFHSGEIYHVYNRGNNRQIVFHDDEDYLLFLRKLSSQLKPHCNILCWCLMPNHFHLLLRANDLSCKERNSYGGKPMQELAYRFGQLLSGYTQVTNKKKMRSGSLFQQKTKAKSVEEMRMMKHASMTFNKYIENVVHYIHQNPVRAGIVSSIEQWPYSSYCDYAGFRNGQLCNKSIIYEMLDIKPVQFVEISNQRLQ